MTTSDNGASAALEATEDEPEGVFPGEEQPDITNDAP